MEEKERFELFGEHCIKDNNPDARCQLLNAYVACVILNEQDKRIKELENENQQLKQQLHDLPKKIVGDIQENFDWKQCCEIRKYYDQQYIWFNYVAFNDFLDTILEKFGGEDE